MPSGPAALSFDNLQIDLVRRAVWRGDVPVRLGARAFDVLAALAYRSGELVSKDELLDAAWPRLVVEEANVQVQVSALRAAIGREAIATVPGLGYRFTLPPRSPDERRRAELAGRSESAEPGHNLPLACEALIGREAECGEVLDALARHRLVTLSGPAGVGKTRIALAVATALVAGVRTTPRLPDGVWWVDLAALQQPTLLPETLAATAGVVLGEGDAEVMLWRALLQRRLLLVLDNAEHLAQPLARLVQQGLAQVPGLQLLVTSQLPLKLATEQCLRVGGLALPALTTQAQLAQVEPAAAATPPDVAGTALALREAPALQLLLLLLLLLRRARAVDYHFDLSEGQLPLAATLCARLDGLPLAIELAAARLPLIGLQALLAMLDDRLTLLGDAGSTAAHRHTTLRAALDWSYSLLSDAQRELLQLCALFTGSFQLGSLIGAAMPAPSAVVVEQLAGLAERSLVQVEAGDPPLYRLLDSTRLYARQALQSRADAVVLTARWREAMRTLARALERALWTQGDSAWTTTYRADHANLAQAFEEALQTADLETVGVVGDLLYQWDHLHGMGHAIRRRKHAAYACWQHCGGEPVAELCNVLAFYADSPIEGLDRGSASARRLAAWRRRDEPWQLYRALGAMAVRHAAAADALLQEAAALPTMPWPPVPTRPHWCRCTSGVRPPTTGNAAACCSWPFAPNRHAR